MAGFAALSSLTAGVRLVRELRLPREHLREQVRAGLLAQLIRSLLLLGVSLFFYGFELFAGWRVLRAPRDTDAVAGIATLVLVTFALGLGHAYELLGARRGGLLSWLSPLRDFDQLVAPSPPSSPADTPRRDRTS